jgi:hypothetical protein
VSREDVRVGLAKYFGGDAVDARGFYRPSPLQSLGLSGVLPYFVSYDGRIDDNRDYFEGLAAGATFGAVMSIHLGTKTETRDATGGLGGGIINRPYATTLYLWYYATRPPSTVAQAAFDDLLDAIEARIRADPTLGMGVNSGAPTLVTQAGEGERGIVSTVPPPYYEPGSYTFGSAVISFDVNTYPAG